MHSSTRKLFFALLFMATFMSPFFSTAMWADDDPLMGTWKLNVAKSSFSPGKPPMSSTNSYKPYGKDGFQYTSDQVSAEGKATHVTFVAEYDGKDYPVTGDPARDAMSARRVDRYTQTTAAKKNGMPTTTSVRVISKDGKTMTITSTGKNVQGQEVHIVYIFEKQ